MAKKRKIKKTGAHGMSNDDILRTSMIATVGVAVVTTTMGMVTAIVIKLMDK